MRAFACCLGLLVLATPTLSFMQNLSRRAAGNVIKGLAASAVRPFGSQVMCVWTWMN